MMWWSDDPVADADRHNGEVYEYEKKCPICDWCDEPITDETFRERTDHKGRKIRYHEHCALEWFEQEFLTLYTDDYIIGESEV